MRKTKRIFSLICALGLLSVGVGCAKETGGNGETNKQDKQYVNGLTIEKNAENISLSFEEVKTVKVSLDITLRGKRNTQTEEMTAKAKAELLLTQTEEFFNAQASVELEGIEDWATEQSGMEIPNLMEFYFLDGYSYVKKTDATEIYYEKSSEKVLDTIAYKMGITATDGALFDILGAIESELEKYEISFEEKLKLLGGGDWASIIEKKENTFSLTYDLKDSITEQIEKICALPGTKTLEETLDATLKEVDESLNCKDILDFACSLGDKKIPVAKAELDEFLGEYFDTDFVSMIKSLQKNEDLIDALTNTLGEEQTKKLIELDIEKQFLELYKDNTVNQVVKAFTSLKYTAKEYIDTRIRPVLKTKVADSQLKALQTELNKYTVTEFLYKQTATYVEKSIAELTLYYAVGAEISDWGEISGEVSFKIKEWSKETSPIRLPENAEVRTAQA